MSAGPDRPGQVARIGGLHIETFGSRDRPAVLMSAGLGGSSAYWTPQVADIARDHCVVLYDHRGTGRSDRSDLPSPYDVADMADDMRVVLDGLGIQAAHVVGHAAGGVAGMALAVRYPGRVASLVMVNGWLHASRHFRRCMAVRRAILLADGAEAYLRAQPVYLYPADWIEANFDHLDAEAAAHVATFQSAATLLARMDALVRFDFRETAAQIATPTLIVAAADDALVPAGASAALVAAIPHARLTRFISGGHAVNITRPMRFNVRITAFLQQSIEHRT